MNKYGYLEGYKLTKEAYLSQKFVEAVGEKALNLLPAQPKWRTEKEAGIGSLAAGAGRTLATKGKSALEWLKAILSKYWGNLSGKNVGKVKDAQKYMEGFSKVQGSFPGADTIVAAKLKPILAAKLKQARRIRDITRAGTGAGIAGTAGLGSLALMGDNEQHE